MRNLLLLTLLVTSISCSGIQQRTHYGEPDMERAGEVLSEVIRYLNGPVRGATYETMFDEAFDASYQAVVEDYRVESLLEAEPAEGVWMLVSRPAPSLYERRVAIGLRAAWDETGRITHYEEIFRTWKMAPEELDPKARTLFVGLVQGKDLSVYWTANSNGEEYIEFPNEQVWFDTDLRRWVRDPEDPLSTLMRENRQQTVQ